MNIILCSYSQRKSENSASQWSDVLTKVTRLVESDPQPDSRNEIDPFASYLSTELKKLAEDEQDRFKFGCMDLLKVIKLSRTVIPDSDITFIQTD